MTDDDFREIALSMEGAIEGAHMGHPDFRGNGRIFASLHTGDTLGMVKLTPEEQGEFLRDHPKTFVPSSGAWGRQGYTNVRLDAADRRAVRSAMLLAWQGVMAKAAVKRARPRAAAAKAAPRARKSRKP